MADYTPTIEDVRNHYAYGCGPDHTWDGSRADFDAWLAERDAKVRAEERAKAYPLIRDLTDLDGCWFDHHGGCQAHGYLTLQPGDVCPQQEAKQWIKEHQS